MADSSHGYVRDRRGCCHWGPHGAAGLLLRQGPRFLLQRRSWRVHHGRTWSIPGGALKSGESPWDGARREFAEELGSVPAVCPVRTFVDDHGGWAYHTVVADVVELFGRHGGDGEGAAHRWCTPAEIDSLRLHPGFAAAWPQLIAGLGMAGR
ncbi:NUDIX hydrolase [Streptomyces sp. 11x1]|uniref:NUDIX hydrolase n=1 Tax=Streptomyces sp. 11x1 TaxID=3038642 RepID=UPI00292F19A0|nr:NUDIX hydrolase [Streptomyces sp. 11x1]WNZ09148.1 NUDIX hydrolase [Streptomyces sp. 11x1]